MTCRLMMRLWVFLRPYWRLMALSLFFVLWMTFLDLLIPYLTKEVIDRYIVISAREVVISDEGESLRGSRFMEQYGKTLVPEAEKGRFLLPPEVLRSMDKKEVARFQKSGLLSEKTVLSLCRPWTQKGIDSLKNIPPSLKGADPTGLFPWTG